MKIRYTKRLSERLKIRKFPYDLPRIVFLQAEKRFRDSLTGYKVAVKKIEYGGEERFIMIAYDIFDKEIVIVTCHPIREEKLKNRIKSGRWLLDQKNSQGTLR